VSVGGKVKGQGIMDFDERFLLALYSPRSWQGTTKRGAGWKISRVQVHISRSGQRRTRAEGRQE
jgi:hypothetical protein